MEKLTATKRQHFVPQHYLRQFCYQNSEQVLAVKVDPYLYIGPAAINRQCQEDYFYGEDGILEDLLQKGEDDIAPVLVKVTQAHRFDQKEIGALQLLAALLHARTRKSSEAAKVVPKKIAYEVINNAISRGELPSPKGGWTEEMMDFKGVSGMLIKVSLSCFLEMRTLECKLLQTSLSSSFITSDNPVVMLNQYAIGAHPVRSFIGFAQTGFQLLLPISPCTTLFFYDPKVYKVGSGRSQIVHISATDTETINSLQIQSADRCIYFNETVSELQVGSLVRAYARLRQPVRDSMRIFPGKNAQEEFIHMQTPPVTVSRPWGFCRYRRHIGSRPGTRRDPAWTRLIERATEDLEKNPGGPDIFERLQILAGLPDDGD